MFGIKDCKKCKDDIPRTYEEYNLKRENDRIKLHTKYICFIAIVIVVWLIATGTADDPKFPEWVSFASTITSIILSVLAIIMSITGEGKTEHIKEQLENAAKQIDISQRNISQINGSIEDNLKQLNSEIKRLSDKIDDVPNKTAQQVNEFQNEKMRDVNSKKNINTKVSYRSWEKPKQ